ncbi:MAG: hypothetical protein BGO38_13325 [Cellulomonas sp. 73-145]|uniref:FkbM family methyltransferase n=1 Tax=unclassified Cellulomonas TaxID=2620175 RepID=UPI00092CBFE8|nr:FkbM family methyltransferase [Cellulomonas sp. 73-145]MBN9328385.1 FkbM family methyltransferase [Cellulomonas sp.]OJV59752.1 MAG: hypothetical protein BGO38_13325 [Cellulomonas sp. 73-145]
MPESVFLSYAQNGEDVVLWRALQHVTAGRYVEVGANHPSEMSVTKAFYDAGWSGITVEPVPVYASLHRELRPRDTLVEAAITDADVHTVTLHEIPGTGLSTLVDAVSTSHEGNGWAHRDIEVAARRLDDVLEEHLSPDEPIHFLLIDVEGAERSVLASVDLHRWRPWVLVVEATNPLSPEPSHMAWEDGVLAADYRLCLFDGLSRFYVAAEHEELAAALSYPACPHDVYDTRVARDAREERRELLDEVLRWRALALEGWARSATPPSDDEAERLRAELAAMRATISWRVTAPLRSVRSRTRG